MEKKELIIVANYSQEVSLTLDELAETLNIPSDFIRDLIAYEIIHPQNVTNSEWVFDLVQLKRIRTAVRLQRDLEVNVAGVGVVLDLLDELEELRDRVELIEKHFLNL